jgi:hypothetical protein
MLKSIFNKERGFLTSMPMLKSIFNKEHSEQFINRINSLNHQTQPQWGKMNVAQMLAHCQQSIRMASGDLKPTSAPVAKFLFGRLAKKHMLNEPELKRNTPTFREGKIAGKRDFETERTKLINIIETFQQKGPAGLTKDPHPFFGEMSVREWDTLQVKHLDHHLRQFGV